MARTLVPIGDHDNMVPRDYAEELVARITRAQLVEVAGAGHDLPFDLPEGFIRHTPDFLADGDSR